MGKLKKLLVGLALFGFVVVICAATYTYAAEISIGQSTETATQSSTANNVKSDTKNNAENDTENNAESDTEIPITGSVTYTYNTLIGTKNTTLKVPVKSGQNYTVTIRFTGAEEYKDNTKARPVRIYYDEVMEDQCYGNINAAYTGKGIDDRSALLYEIPSYGKIDVREFSVAALHDTLTLIIVGDATLVDITVAQEKEKNAGEKPTIYIIGDSLVQTYNSSYYPMTGWGQMLANYFTDDINIVNKALGGRSTLNYLKQGRLNDVLTYVRPGDIVLVSFGTNDGGAVAGRAVTVEKYRDYLENYYIKGVRERGGIPVIVTHANQNIISNEGVISTTYAAFVEAAILSATNTGANYIDLNLMSREKLAELYSTIGIRGIKDIYYNAFRAGIFKNYLTGAGDSTHYQTYGANTLAQMVAKGIFGLNITGVSEYYVPDIVYTEAPAAVQNISFDYTNYDESYRHMDWDAVPNARYYRIERVKEVKAWTKPEEWEVLGYSAVNMFADPSADSAESYFYQIIAINEAGESEPAEIFGWGANKEEIMSSWLSSQMPEDAYGIIEQGGEAIGDTGSANTDLGNNVSGDMGNSADIGNAGNSGNDGNTDLSGANSGNDGSDANNSTADDASNSDSAEKPANGTLRTIFIIVVIVLVLIALFVSIYLEQKTGRRRREEDEKKNSEKDGN